MPSESSDSDPESDSTGLIRAKVRLRVERAAVPTLGELEGVKLVIETTSGGRLVRIAVVLAVVAALVHFGLLPAPW